MLSEQIFKHPPHRCGVGRNARATVTRSDSFTETYLALQPDLPKNLFGRFRIAHAL
jgi:hypothetical protein